MGGTPSIPQRNLTKELTKTFGAFKNQELPLFNDQWFDQQPLLSGSRDVAMQGLQQVWPAALSQLLPVIQRGGALTPEQERDVDQATRTGFAERGNLMGNQALGAELLNRDVYRRQRFGEALSQTLGAESGTISPALQTEQTATGTFATLMNPLLVYAGDLNSSNQNAAAAQSIAGANKGGGIAGGALSAIGSVAAAY